MSATETAIEMAQRVEDDRRLHHRMKWFFEKHAPSDPRDADEFHADFHLVVQAIHTEAGRTTQHLLMNALATSTLTPIFIDKQKS